MVKNDCARWQVHVKHLGKLEMMYIEDIYPYLPQGHLMLGPHTNRDSCVVGAKKKKKKIDLVGIPVMKHLEHLAMNLVLQAGKDRGKTPWNELIMTFYRPLGTNIW